MKPKTKTVTKQPENGKMILSSAAVAAITFICIRLLYTTAATTSTVAPPLQVWIDETAFGGGETQLLREAIHDSHGEAAVAGETRTTFLTPKGWQNLKAVDVFWTGRQGCYAAYKQHDLNYTHSISCVPGTQSITGKAALIKTLTTAYGTAAFSIIPTSYILPEQYYALAKEVTRQKRKVPWVLKEDAHRGKGVYVAQGSDVLTKARETVGGRGDGGNKYVLAQRFMKDQFLVNGRPFYIRVWAVVAGGSPLRAFLYKGGVVIYGEEQTTEAKKAADSMIVNLWIQDRKSAAPGGVHQLRDYIIETTANGEGIFEGLWQSIENSVAASLAAAAPTIRASTSKKQLPNYQQAGFEFLGFDFLVDSSFKPWIIEVNWLPSLAKKVIGCRQGQQSGCRNDDPFDLEKQHFVTSLLDLLIARKQHSNDRAFQAQKAVVQLRNNDTSFTNENKSENQQRAVCVSTDQLRRLLDTRHEAAAASARNFSVLHRKVYTALECMDGSNNEACLRILPLANASTTTYQKGFASRVFRTILRRLPIINRYLPKLPSYKHHALTEYDRIVADWLERDAGDEELPVETLLARMCSRVSSTAVR